MPRPQIRSLHDQEFLLDLAAFFADIDDTQHFKKGTNSLPTARPPEIEVLSKRERAQLDKLEAEKQELVDAIDAANPNQVASTKAKDDEQERLKLAGPKDCQA